MDKKKILVVEDEKAIADILVFNLQREGYDTLAAYDGAEGLRCALSESPDLILLDVMLPERDGTYSRIRPGMLARTSRIPLKEGNFIKLCCGSFGADRARTPSTAAAVKP